MGGYVVVEFMYQNKKILIVNIYTPNGVKTQLFQYLQKQINTVTYEYLIIVGDFSGTIDNEMDRSDKGKTNRKKIWEITKDLL